MTFRNNFLANTDLHFNKKVFGTSIYLHKKDVTVEHVINNICIKDENASIHNENTPWYKIVDQKVISSFHVIDKSKYAVTINDVVYEVKKYDQIFRDRLFVNGKLIDDEDILSTLHIVDSRPREQWLTINGVKVRAYTYDQVYNKNYRDNKAKKIDSQVEFTLDVERNKSINTSTMETPINLEEETPVDLEELTELPSELITSYTSVTSENEIEPRDVKVDELPVDPSEEMSNPKRKNVLQNSFLAELALTNAPKKRKKMDTGNIEINSICMPSANFIKNKNLKLPKDILKTLASYNSDSLTKMGIVKVNTLTVTVNAQQYEEWWNASQEKLTNNSQRLNNLPPL